MADLIDEDTGAWKADLITETSYGPDADAIRAMLRPRNGGTDFLVMTFGKD